MKSNRRIKKRRHGAAVVEFAVVAPLFIMLVFGMIEYGRMAMVQQVLTNASRVGARRAVIDGATSSEIQTAVNDYLSSAKISGATITVSPNDPSSASYGDPISVSVSVDFSQVSWLPSPMYLGGTQLEGQAIMRSEIIR
ncbi:MAG: pilus assembly protein [Pirellulaceae bacterium]|nr:pilus assembly protein [Pirellulaceae bacterium]